jgi:hypothetical protein
LCSSIRKIIKRVANRFMRGETNTMFRTEGVILDGKKLHIGDTAVAWRMI